MKTLSNEFKQALALNQRNYEITVEIVWPYEGNTRQTLSLTNAHIWSGGYSYEQLVSEDEEFTALGAAYVGTSSLIINNMDESYNDYVFEEAEKVVISVCMRFPADTQSGTRLESHKIGTYHVSDVSYNGSLITISLQDNIAKFDKPYSNSSLTYPATLGQIVNNACSDCGVTLYTQQFPNYTDVIQERPEDDNITYRNVISWVATIAGCFVVCNPDGQLVFNWFNQQVIEQELQILDGGTLDPWSSGTNYDGGTVDPWTEGTVIDAGDSSVPYNFHTLTSLFSQSFAMDDIVITGISIQVEKEDDNTVQTFTRGTEGYVISIEDNKFITPSNVQTILNRLAIQLIGFEFRKLRVNIPSDPSIEVGDIALVYDRKGKGYIGLVTRTKFSIAGSQEVVSGGSTPTRNSGKVYSDTTRNMLAIRNSLSKQKTAFDEALKDLSDRLDSSAGLYPTIEQTQSGNIYYLHDQPLLADSKTVMKITNEAIGITNDYKGAQTVWNFGVTVNGTTITRILNSIGINADWINTGTISVKKTVSGTERELLKIDVDTGQIVVKNRSGDVLMSIDGNNGTMTLNPTSFTLTSGNTTTIDNMITGKGYQTANQVENTITGKGYQTENQVQTKIEANSDSIRLQAKKIVWSSTNSSMSENGTLTCNNAVVSGTITAGTGSQIGEMKAGVNSSTPCFYSGERKNYNIVKDGICIESNGNFGISGNLLLWKKKSTQMHVVEWNHVNYDTDNWSTFGIGYRDTAGNNLKYTFEHNSYKGTTALGFLQIWKNKANDRGASNDGSYSAFEINDGFNNRTAYIRYDGYSYTAGELNTSDERKKSIISKLDNSFKDLFMSISPIVFQWKKELHRGTKIHFGIGAQTFQKSAIEYGYDNLAIIDDTDKDNLSANYTELLMLSIPVVQEHEQKIEQLEAKVKEQDDKINELEERLARLEKLLEDKM